VEAGGHDNGELTVGTDLTAVFWDSDRARAERAYVYAEAPFFVACADRGRERQLPEPGLLLWTRGDEVLVSDIRAFESEPRHDKSLVGMNVGEWRKLDDRRRSPRIRCSASASIRPYHFDEEIVGLEPNLGRAEDVSMAGALVHVGEDLPVGQVVECTLVLEPGVVVSALSVVARRDEPTGAIGIAFLEFLENGETDLARYISRAA
jgi:hypothetical protein